MDADTIENVTTTVSAIASWNSIKIAYENATMNTNANQLTSLPKFTREFPRKIDFLLPLRHSMRFYAADGGPVVFSDESPETDSTEVSTGEMYAMTIQVPICGHATFVTDSTGNGGCMQVCEPAYAHMNSDEMSKAIQIVNSGSLKWVNRFNGEGVAPITPPNAFIERSSYAYQSHGPLLVYTNTAAIEAANYSGDSNFWRSLFPPMELIDCHYGLAGLLYDNNVISMGDMCGTDENAVVENRVPKAHHRGFIDVCFTPQSKGAGRVRMLAFGVSIRIATRRTVTMACKLISTVKCQIGTGFGDWVLRCMGFTTTITIEDVTAIVSAWKIMNEFNMPTVHVFEKMKVVVISIASGVLIRPVRTIVTEAKFARQGPFVDSMCVYHSDTMRFAGLTFPDPEIEPMQFSSTSCLIIPFFRWTTEPRINLGIQMTMQGMNEYPIRGDATIVSLGKSEPVIKTAVLDAIMSESTTGCEIVVPGKNVVMAFVNRKLNTEDACTISKEFAESGAFAWSGYIDYPLPSVNPGKIEPGMIIENEPWWKPAMKGQVVKVFMNKNGGFNATIAIFSKELSIGDKLATWHGVKFTVGEIIPLAKMPLLVDTVTNENIRPNMLVSTKNLTRGLGGQIREMGATTSLFKSIMSFRIGAKPVGKTTLTQIDETVVTPTIPSAYVTDNGKRIVFADGSMGKRTVVCNYGIMRVQQLRHVSALKQHYPSSATNSITVPRGRYRSGTPRTGETELLSMMMQGGNVAVSEALINSDKVNADICSVCNAIPYFCDCPFPKPDTTKMGIRYSALQLNTYATTAMLNDGKGNAMTIRFSTRT